jgi:hypothetical protein
MYEVLLLSDIVSQCSSFGGVRGQGAEAEYYQLNPSEGIKIIKRPVHMWSTDYDNERYHTSVQTLVRSTLFDVVRTMYSILEEMSKIERAPKPYQLVIVSYHDVLYPAIIMEHIKWKPITDVANGDLRKVSILDRAYWRLARSIGHRFGVGDVHQENLVYDVVNKRFKMIDVGSFSVDRRDHRALTGLNAQYKAYKEYRRRTMARRAA